MDSSVALMVCLEACGGVWHLAFWSSRGSRQMDIAVAVVSVLFFL